MLISPANYKKQISASVLKDAKQLLLQKAVRELDEVDTGKFVAYVDEGVASYDVMLQMNARQQVQGHQCDCGSEYFFCAHQTAVYLHLLEQGTAVQMSAKVRKSKKTLEREAFFEQVSNEQIKQWLWQFFEKDKAAKLQFLQAFIPVSTEITPAEIREKTLNITEAIVGRKRRVDAEQAKKLVHLWGNFHGPIVKEYLSNLNRVLVWEGLYQLVDACKEVNSHVMTNSRRVDSYLLHLQADLQAALQGVSDEKEGMQLVDLIVPCCRVSKGQGATNLFFLELILHTVPGMPDTIVAHVCKAIMELHEAGKLPVSRYPNFLDYILFQAFSRQDAVVPFLVNFKVHITEKEYNLNLIRLLTKKGFLERAIQCCQQCIQGHYSEEFLLPYYYELEKLFELNGDKQAGIQITMKVVELTYNFTKFKELAQLASKYPSIGKWKKKWIALAMNRMHYSVEAQSFCIAYCIEDADDKELDSYIKESTSLTLILHYFSDFFRVNKDKLLHMLMTRTYRKWGSPVYGSNSIHELIPLLRSHYTDAELLDAENKLKNSFNSRSYELPKALQHVLHPTTSESKGKK